MKILNLDHYIPYNEQEERDLALFKQCLDIYDDVLTRENVVAHIGCSAFVVNADRTKVLMLHHNIYKSWSLPGGHADGNTNLLGVAMEELEEETGVTDYRPVMEDLLSIEILPVIGHYKRGQYVSAHLHLDTTFLIEANDQIPLVVKEDENSAVKWVPIDEVVDHSTEAHMKMVYAKLIDKVKVLGL